MSENVNTTEFPKMLYLSADSFELVNDADEEKAARAAGYTDYADLPDDADEVKKPASRKPAAKPVE